VNEKYHKALQEALEWINNHYHPIGIVVSGSIIRGNAHHNSDFDIYVVHEGDYRQRVQKLFNEVPCEIFINNTGHIELYFEEELKNNRPVTAHILATGTVYAGNDHPEIISLIAAAKEYSNKIQELTAAQLCFKRYALAGLLEDATDMMAVDKLTALHILDKVVIDSIAFIYHINSTPLPRLKERLVMLQKVDAVAGNKVARYYMAAEVEAKYAVAKELVQHIAGASGFFEWDSERE
jgi:predicted nucleotidyltransferase